MSPREAAQTRTGDARREPRWGVIGIAAAAAVVLAIVTIVAIRSLQAAPLPALGETLAADLVVGSCLAEDGTQLMAWTVIDCAAEHPQQVVAEIDLAAIKNVYSEFSAMAVLAEEICDRYLEYGLFVREEAHPDSHDLVVIAFPTEEEFETGRARALCSLVALDGAPLTSDYAL